MPNRGDRPTSDRNCRLLSTVRVAFRQKTVDALAQLADLRLQGRHLRLRGGLLLGVLLLDQRDDPRGQVAVTTPASATPPIMSSAAMKRPSVETGTVSP